MSGQSKCVLICSYEISLVSHCLRLLGVPYMKERFDRNPSSIRELDGLIK